MRYLEAERSIIIWGAGSLGSYVINNFSNIYNIKFIVDNKVKVDNKEHLKNVAVYNPAVLRDRKLWDDSILVLCLFKVEELKEQLNSFGLKIFEDFIPWYLLDYNFISMDFLVFLEKDSDKEKYIKKLAAGRKICALYGMCHMSIYRNFLLKSKKFLNEYVILDIPAVNDKSSKHHNVLKSDFIWNSCDLVITSLFSPINLWDVPCTKEVLEKLNRSCKKIVVTNAAFKGYFLQHTIGIKETAQYFGWGDKNINRMIKKGETLKEIENKILETEFYDYEFINKYFDRSLKILEEGEEECDIKIGDYIKDNGKIRVLYYSWTHPKEEVMLELGKRIFAALELDGSVLDNFANEIILNTNEELIYPCVLKALGIEDADKFTIKRKMNPGHLWKDNLITSREYIKEYVSMNTKFLEDGNNLNP